MNYLKYLKSAGVVLFVFSVTHIVFMLTVDPFRLFHDGAGENERYMKDLRFQGAGIIRNVEFDSVIIGTSMSANFSPEYATQLFGEKFVNISMNGSYLSERDMVLKFLFSKKKPKTVILSLDGYGKVGEYNEKYPIDNYKFLYNKSRYDDIRLYAGAGQIKYGLCRFLGAMVEKCKKKISTLDKVSRWDNDVSHMSRFGGMENWISAKKNLQIHRALKELKKAISCIDNPCQMEVLDVHKKYFNNIIHAKNSYDAYVLSLVAENPETRFIGFFPPYSRLRYAIWAQASWPLYEQYLEAVEYVVNKSKYYNNFRIYGFDDMRFLDNIENYKDLGHYHPKYDHQLLTLMAENKHILNKSNINAYLRKIKSKALGYDVKPIGVKMSKYNFK